MCAALFVGVIVQGLLTHRGGRVSLWAVPGVRTTARDSEEAFNDKWFHDTGRCPGSLVH
jgi:hypothetical protein